MEYGIAALALLALIGLALWVTERWELAETEGEPCDCEWCSTGAPKARPDEDAWTCLREETEYAAGPPPGGP